MRKPLDKDAKNRIKQSLNDSFKALVSTIKAAYGLAPFAVIAIAHHFRTPAGHTSYAASAGAFSAS
jgi:hypothetical protein